MTVNSTVITFVSTTNPSFKYLEGMKSTVFKIGSVIWFEDFHTSNLKSIKYKYTDKYTELKVKTLNSMYVFRIMKENK